MRRKQTLPLHLDEAFGFFTDASNLERITPPELNFRIVTEKPIRMELGTLIEYRLRLHGIPLRWRTEITKWEPPNSFVDTALRSPYRTWVHTHSFSANPEGGTDMVDEVRYRLPFAPVGNLVHPFVRSELNRIFDFRREEIEDILFSGMDSPAANEVD